MLSQLAHLSRSSKLHFALEFKSQKSTDKRKNKSLLWGEARLSLAREMGSVTPRLAATMEEAQQAGAVWLDCVKRAGGGERTKIHCVGDAAPWILEQARQ